MPLPSRRASARSLLFPGVTGTDGGLTDAANGPSSSVAAATTTTITTTLPRSTSTTALVCNNNDDYLSNKPTTTGVAAFEVSGGGGGGVDDNGDQSYGGAATDGSDGDNNNKLAAGAGVVPCFVIQITALASLGGVLFGYDLSVISSVLPSLSTTFHLSFQQQEMVVGVLYLGGCLGASIGGSICDLFGRKRAILITDGCFLLGSIMLAVAQNLTMIVLGRVVVGFAVAVSGIADVAYLHEIAPVQFRGSIVSVNEACISLGFLLSFCLGNVLASSSQGTTSHGWRSMFGAAGLVAAIQAIGMWTLPESPRWLEEQGRHEEAEAATRRINADSRCWGAPTGCSSRRVVNNNDYEHYDECDGHQRQQLRSLSSSFSSSLHRNNAPGMQQDSCTVGQQRRADAMTTTPTAETSNTGIIGHCSYYCCQCVYLVEQFCTFAAKTPHQTCIALFLAIAQQFSGQTNVVSYAPFIFASANNGGQQQGDDSNNNSSDVSSFVSGWWTMSIGIVKFIVTVLVIWKIEVIGRRRLLLWGMGTICCGLLLLSLSFGGIATLLSTGQDGEGKADDREEGLVVALAGVLLVVCGYSMSFGPLTWLLTSELFPTDIRGRALGVSTIVTYLFAYVVTSSFLSAQESWGAHFVFGVYFLLTLCGYIFAYLAIPDTGGKCVDEIAEDIASMPWWQQRRADDNL